MKTLPDIRTHRLVACLLATVIAGTTRANEQTVVLEGPLFEATVHRNGVLVGAPESGVVPSWGPAQTIGPRIHEWHGFQFEDHQGTPRTGVLGSTDDWAGRDAVAMEHFEFSPSVARSVGRLGPLVIVTDHRFVEGGAHLLARTTLTNSGTDTLRRLVFSYEWLRNEPGGVFPPDLAGLVPPAPVHLSRSLWLLDELPAGRSTTITQSYSLPPAADPEAQVDVPLTWYTSPSYPGGLPIGFTNGVSWGDHDADGWPDFFTAAGVELWRNLKGQDFRRLTNLQSQLDPAVYRYGSAFGDYNNDGLPDLGTEPRGPDMHLFRNDGGVSKFTLVSTDPNIVDNVPFGLSETLCWADVDHDGDLDYFLPVYPPWGGGGPGNFFLHNLGPTGPGGAYRFTEVTQAVGLWNPPQSAKPEGAEVVDYDFDGDLDIYSNGTLYQNDSAFDAPLFRWMSETASGVLFRTDQDEGCAFLDYDMDGDEDLIIAFCLGGHGVRIFENQGDGMFFLADKNIIDSPDTGLCLGFSKADWDNDGDIDISTKEVFRRNQFMETGTRKYTVATHNLTPNEIAGATPAWADFDRDGDLDTVIGNYGASGTMWRNTTYNALTPDRERRALRVRVLNDSPTAKRGLETEYGARVQMHVQGEENQIRRTQFVTSAGGYLNQNEYAVHLAIPPDPTPGDPNQDVVFDLVVTFPSDPAVGLRRIDRHVNAELGNIDWGTLTNREIWVYRSGRVKINGCFFEPTSSADPVLTTTSGGLALPTDTVPLPPLSTTPGTDWSVGVEFDTSLATGPLRIKEVIVDGELDTAAICGADTHRVMLWDVTTAGNPTLVDAFDTRKWKRNLRHRYRTNTLLEPGRRYRLIARVKQLRPTAIPAPVVHDQVTVHGGLSFQDTNPCNGTAVEAATVDPTNTYISFRFAEDPGETWADLGLAIDGTNGTPTLTGSGPMTAGSPVTVTLGNSLSTQMTFLVIGNTALGDDFAGGTLLPTPEFILFPFTDPTGTWTLTAPWPPGSPPGDTLYYQAWFQDPGAIQGWAASNALSGTTPF